MALADDGRNIVYGQLKIQQEMKRTMKLIRLRVLMFLLYRQTVIRYSKQNFAYLQVASRR